MNNSFNELGIIPPILKAIEDMGFTIPTEVQSKAIPAVLDQKDLIVMSKTGSGKTAAFGIPMLQSIDPASAAPMGLILTPTRELAVQIDSDLKQMSKYLRHKTTAVFGQHSMNTEIQALKRGVGIVTGTPGRVYDHITSGNLTTSKISFLVLDEADRMLDMGFIDQVVRIIKKLPRDRVTLLFSATIPSEVRRICRDYMKNPSTVEIESQTKTVETIKQLYYRVDPREKRTQLNRLLIVEQPESCMIFCNTRIAVDRVQSFLSQKGYACEALHGDIPQGKRLKTIKEFKEGGFHLLVATDVAARGLHIEDLSLVINYDVPQDKDSYIHRIGRTGRAGKGGRAISLVTGDDIMSLYEIEEHIGAMITEEELPSEEVYNSRRAEASKWLEDNAQKARPVRPPSASGPKDNRRRENSKGNPPSGKSQPYKKKSDQKPPYKSNENRTKPYNKNSGSTGGENRPGTADKARPAASRPQNVRQTPAKQRTDSNNAGMSQNRPQRSAPPRSGRPSTPYAPRDQKAPAQNNTVASQSSDVTRESFLKRLWRRVLGK